MFRKRSLIVILTLLCVLCVCGAQMSALGQEPDDPAAQLPSGQESATAESGVTPYTAAEFDQLPDDQKKQVYLNSPELLPLNFDPNQYKQILHPSSDN